MNRIVHFEIQATDMDVLQKFYSDVFGWTFQDMGPDMGNYRVVTTGTEGAGINGGMMKRAGDRPPSGASANAFVCIVDVDDIDVYMNKAKSAGGVIALDKIDVPDIGLLAYFKDPDGNTFGMLQPIPMESA